MGVDEIPKHKGWEMPLMTIERRQRTSDCDCMDDMLGFGELIDGYVQGPSQSKS